MSGTTRSGSTTYFDTNIWVAYMLNESDLCYFVNRIINKMLKVEHHVYVSDLVLLETISSISRKIPIKTKTTAESRSRLEEKIAEKTHKCITTLEAFRQERRIINKIPPLSVNDLHKAAFDYLGKYFGSVEKHGKHYRYKGLNHWDIQRVLIARALGAETFYTADTGIETLKKSQMFNPMKFVINTP